MYTLFLRTHRWRHHASGKMGFFGVFSQILPQFKNFFKTLSVCIILYTRCHLCAEFDILGPSRFWDIVWRKNSYPPRNPPAYFAIALRNMTLHRYALWTQEGGLNGFMHSFLAEVMAICRAHVAALGGNALVAFQLTECIIEDNVHKNQVNTVVLHYSVTRPNQPSISLVLANEDQLRHPFHSWINAWVCR